MIANLPLRLLQLQWNKKDIPTHAVGAVSMEGIMIDTAKPRRVTVAGVSIPSPPVLDRAQKFRERARSTTIGRPQFKLSQKKASSTKNLYEALGQAVVASFPAALTMHPHPFTGNMAEFRGVEMKDMPPRRVSEDTTSHNSEMASPNSSTDNYLNLNSDTICTDV